ncbi:MAG TPA: hypothetical protein VK892_13270 [Pyrinomonadaceae bacterium]|nr:hypothetical protein [Pyrinomonadaceae bacterium]
MQPNLTLKNGQTIPLTNEVYDAVLQIVEKEGEKILPADSIEELEAEFADLFSSTEVTTEELLQERKEELKREKKKLDVFG